MTKCHVCFRHCDLKEGQIGFCGARICAGGKVTASNYGRITSLALDPIEKKPLRRFFPGTKILSAGSYGCNLRCPFCQNSEISWGEEAKEFSDTADTLSPDVLVRIAEKYRIEGNIGIAFTYNEPLVGYEFVRDTAKLAHEKGMKNVLVSNGTASLSVLSEILPYIDAMNIDLKCFDEKTYREVLGGDLEMTKAFISEAAREAHVEVTCLIVPGLNDTEEEMRELSSWIASLKDEDGNVTGDTIPLHISRFFPRFHMTDRAATSVERVYSLAEIAREKLKYVYTGNC
ncbi:MAG: AmmeMemoRadiSam system radical SAM enzyme [Clostridiales bacterium]|nr:AmmeMemoRadiSam system radical SAM enzyme [Clostridiales bacterium]